MRVIVRSKDVRLWLLVPLSLASVAVALLPESALDGMRQSLPESCRGFVTRPLLRELVRECRSVLKCYKGLEIVHVEAQDGTFISIRL